MLKVKGYLPYLVMVFLNAFVDLGHKIVIQNTIFKTYDGSSQVILTAIINALILLPFILLFSPSGFISDKYPKQRVMQMSAWAAVGITLAITACYYLGWFWVAFAMTFLLALQSAIYSPAKYGYIKELLGKDRLARGNGVVQAITTISILGGIFAYSILFEGYLVDQPVDDTSHILMTIAPLGWSLVALSVIELLMAYRLPQTQPVDSKMSFDIKAYRRGTYLKENLTTVSRNSVIWLSIIGLTVFWAVSQVMLAAFPAFAKSVLSEDNTVVIQGLLACTGIGIMLGSLLAGRVSKHHIETGIIPLGAVGVALGLFLIPLISSTVSFALVFILIGVAGGLFIIPLNALIQFHAPEHESGRILAGNNFVQNVGMLSFLVMTVLLAMVGIDGAALIWLLCAVASLGALYTMWKLPQSLVRYLLAIIATRGYRLRVDGFKHIPEQGGVLMLGNHISWIDWAIVQIASPRPVRFVMEKSIYQRWYLNWFFRLFDVVPIASGDYRKSVARIAELLNQGEVVCLFPEGTISRNGQLAEFKHGYTKAAALANADVKILPFYLRGLWGSRFSRASAKLRSNREQGRRRDVVVSFGLPMAITTTPDELKRRVSELSVQAWEHYTKALPSVPAAWVRTASRVGGNTLLTDSDGNSLSGRRALAVTHLLANRLASQSKKRRVGVLLPASNGGALANMALLMRAKAVVNLNYTASLCALEGAITNADLDLVVTSKRFVKKLEKRGFAVEALFSSLHVIYLEDLFAKVSPWSVIWRQLLVTALPISLLQWLFVSKIDVERTAAIMFSSGSEGSPKGVKLSHRNLMANIKQVSDLLNTQDSDVMMGSLPLFHAFGLTVTTLMPMVEGIPLVSHPDPTDVSRISKAIARYDATLYCATSSILRLMTNSRQSHPLMLSSLRLVVSGAERLDSAVRDGFQNKYGQQVVEGYGTTETTPVASVNVPDQLDTRYWTVQKGNKPGTVGMALPGSSFRIVDPDSLALLPQGEAGLILIGGAQVMKGYLNDPERTADAVVEIDGIRWYKTGDKGWLDEDGFLTVVDRYSRFAKIAGEMVSLSAVETSLSELLSPQFPELSLAVVAIADERKGERLVVLVDQDISLTELRQQCKTGELNNLFLPAAVIKVDGLPTLGSGKIDYQQVKALAVAM
ncbi:acyl-[ACP]--phospholipid O-acyltransferase [Corallincola luteus]|uniref:Acyl-[ACP]--phospholipid O-acyltransferase n=1 Tax=Corallincola luteus TaxID=1775177 RepID=A0ABY2ALQ9_9GAMM|nr:acyl-[ACP]--phospholipid O-acyltransferase [Corallincola luteus]TCI03656.1 acyl-[ACP]--phospholipid O-acyltransferase [Corallincola luteus]